jgi:hypothetical protein
VPGVRILRIPQVQRGDPGADEFGDHQVQMMRGPYFRERPIGRLVEARRAGLVLHLLLYFQELVGSMPGRISGGGVGLAVHRTNAPVFLKLTHLLAIE